MIKRTKSKSTKLIPTSRQAAVEQMAQYAKTVTQIERIEADLTDNIAALKATASEQAAGLKALSKSYVKGLEIYCEHNRDELTKHGKVKSHDFGTGKVKWRNLPPKVTIKGVDEVLERIQALNSKHEFLRTKFEIDKEAMLAAPEKAQAIEGVTIVRDQEEIVLEPLTETTGD